MAISSVGAGAGVLTQDVLDQLREADDAQYVTPIELSLANEDDRKNALKTVDASMTNLIDSIDALKDSSLFSQRSTTVVGTSVEVSAAINSDQQDFSLDVVSLATKQIEQSGAFTSKTDEVDSSAGSFDIQVGAGDAITINYEAGATLDDIKNLINAEAGDLVDASIVQLNVGEFRLFLSSSETGASQDISITSSDTLDTKLTTDFDAAEIQAGTNAKFKFNGGTTEYERSSNTIDDLIVGLDITLKETGVSDISVKQDNESILEKVNSFVSKYNETMTELSSMTKSSLDSEERGIFSSDSTIKGMQSTLVSMITNTTSGSMFDFGFDLDKDGKLSIDSTEFEEQLNNNNDNVKAFLAGGTYTNSDSSTVELDGAFVEFSNQIEEYTEYDAILDQMKKSITEATSTLEDRKADMIERLDSKYETMQKRFIAYDIMMSKLNSASSMFTEMTAASESE